MLNSYFTQISVLIRHLKLSITSINFYSDVYKRYSGYGTKYLFTISAFSSLIYCAFILNTISDIKNYLNYKTENTELNNMEYIVSQLPEMLYDGTKLHIKNDNQKPIVIYDLTANKIIAIDTYNSLTLKEKKDIPIISLKDKVLFYKISKHKSGNNEIQIALDYKQIFGTSTIELKQETFKKYISTMLNYASNLTIYLFTPIIIIARFVVILFDKSFMMIFLYFAAKIFGVNANMQSCIRLVCFSSGVSVLLQPLIMTIAPQYHLISWIIQIFCNILMFGGLFSALK
jgi:hypothetical protein